MPRYIDADALLKHECEADKMGAMLVVGKGYILSATTADVAPVVRGEWKYYHKQNKAVCTNCSFERDLDADFGAAVSCPNCGCKIDGGEKHE